MNIMTKHNKDIDKLKSSDIRKILNNIKKIMYKKKKPFTNTRNNNNKKTTISKKHSS